MTRSLPSPKLLVTGGAVAVASVAYAIGSQAGGGTAGAATTSSPSTALVATGTTGATGSAGARHRFGRHGRGLGAALTEAAQALGVSEAKLRTALSELRPPAGAKRDRRADLTAALAKSLGVSEAKVAEALEAQRPARPDRTERFSALAEELGLSAAKVRAAFEAVRPERRAQRGSQGGRDAFLTALAGELGVTKEKLATALGTTGGPGFGRRGGHRHGPGGRGALDTAAFARALGVPEADVTKALDAFRDEQRKAFDALRADLTKQLAGKLGVSVEEVERVAERYLPGAGRRAP